MNCLCYELLWMMLAEFPGKVGRGNSIDHLALQMNVRKRAINLVRFICKFRSNVKCGTNINRWVNIVNQNWIDRITSVTWLLKQVKLLWLPARKMSQQWVNVLQFDIARFNSIRHNLLEVLTSVAQQIWCSQFEVFIQHLVNFSMQWFRV